MPTVLITGANRGIGFALAQQYAADGWKVIGTARDLSTATELQTIRGDIHVEALEVTEAGSIERLSSALTGEKIDVLWNNSGISGREAQVFGEIDGAVFLETLRVNTVAPIMICQALVENVARSDQKKMVFTSSRLGSIELNSGGGRYGYNPSKAGLNMASKSLSIDLRSRGIITTVLHPGHVRTDMGGASAPVLPNDSAAGMRKVVAGLTPEQSGAFINYDGSPIPW